MMIMFSLEQFLISQGKNLSSGEKEGNKKLVELLAMICEKKMKVDSTAEKLLLGIVLSLVLERQQQSPNVPVKFHSTYHSEDPPHTGIHLKTQAFLYAR